MAGLKELKVRIKSVQNTKKITYAMKLVSAAKLRKSQEAVVRSGQYTEALNRLLHELSMELAGVDFVHPLMQPRAEVRKIRLLVIGGGRGLCGGYNSNINRKIEALFKEKKAQNPAVEIETVILGKKPAEYYRRIRRSYLNSYEALPDDANQWPIEDVCRELEAAFVNGEADEVYVIYTKFKSALSMKVLAERLLPMEMGAEQESAQAGERSGVTLFEPSVREVFTQIIPRIMRSKVRQAALDARASEHGSRMTAMEAATKNAGQLIRKLQLTYNKARQTKITSELLDIIGGSGAAES